MPSAVRPETLAHVFARLHADAGRTGDPGVTVRTMYRDLDALREAAMPLAAERGRGGGYALDRSYSLPPVNFTARSTPCIGPSDVSRIIGWLVGRRAR
jgi:predicted DNA-binding transcriptional regulator YafY